MSQARRRAAIIDRGVFAGALLGAVSLAALSAPAQTPARGNAIVTDGDWSAAPQDYQSVVVQIDSDQNGAYNDSRLNAQTIVALAQSTFITDPAIEHVLGLKPADARASVSIAAVATGQRFMQLTISLKPMGTPPKPDATQALIREICDRVRGAALQSATAQAAVFDDKYAALQADLVSARAKWEKASAASSAAQQTSRLNATGNNNPESNLRYQRQGLMDQQRQLEAQLAGWQARLAVVNNAPVATQPSSTGNSPLDQLIVMRQKALDDANVRLSKQQATPAEVATAQSLLADAYALNQAVTQMSNAQRTPAYRDPSDPQVLAANIAETSARLDLLKKQIASLPPSPTETATSQPAGTTPEDAFRLQQDEQRARSEMEAITQQLNEFRRQRLAAATVVRLTVLDGTPTTQPGIHP